MDDELDMSRLPNHPPASPRPDTRQGQPVWTRRLKNRLDRSTWVVRRTNRMRLDRPQRCHGPRAIKPCF
jgi:hypothetical protein